MKVTKVDIYAVKHNTLKANATITFDDCFVVKGLKVVKGKKGLFVTMPSYEYNGEWKDLCFPLSKEFRTEISNAVLDAYDNR